MPPLSAKVMDRSRPDGFEAWITKKLIADEGLTGDKFVALAHKVRTECLKDQITLKSELAIYEVEDEGEVAAWVEFIFDDVPGHNEPIITATLMTEQMTNEGNLAGGGTQRLHVKSQPSSLFDLSVDDRERRISITYIESPRASASSVKKIDFLQLVNDTLAEIERLYPDPPKHQEHDHDHDKKQRSKLAKLVGEIIGGHNHSH